MEILHTKITLDCTQANRQIHFSPDTINLDVTQVRDIFLLGSVWPPTDDVVVPVWRVQPLSEGVSLGASGLWWPVPRAEGRPTQVRAVGRRGGKGQQVQQDNVRGQKREENSFWHMFGIQVPKITGWVVASLRT